MTKKSWFLITSSLITVTSIIDLIGLSPWPLTFTLIGLLTFFIARKNGFVLGLTLALAILMASLAIWYQVSARLPWDLRSETFFLEVVFSIVLSILIGNSQPSNIPVFSEIRSYWPAFIVPLITGFFIFCFGITSQLGYSWAMQNDAIWNLVVSRFVTNDGGVISERHPNPSPLIPELLSFSSLSGRSNQNELTLFQHDITRAAETWLILALLCSLLSGLIALSLRNYQNKWLRILSGLIASAIPLSWFSFGYALEFGFYNASIATLLMLLIWALWQTGKHLPYHRLGGLAVILLCCLSAWGPLAAIPVSLSFVALIEIFRHKDKPQSTNQIVFCAATWLIVIVYGLLITIPDIQKQSGSLSADGGIFEIHPITAALTVFLSTVAIVFVSLQLKDKNSFWGIIFFAFSCLAAIAYLALQRGAEVSKWGYYPVKFTWLLMIFLIILLCVFMISWIDSTRYNSKIKTTLLIASLVSTVFLAWQMPIRTPPTNLSFFPLLNILTHTGVAKDDSYSDRLFSLAVQGKPTIAFQGQDKASDQFVNQWLLQIESQSSEDKIRYWAYFLDSTNKDQLCAALKDWAKPVRIVTAESGLSQYLGEQCQGAVFFIEEN